MSWNERLGTRAFRAWRGRQDIDWRTDRISAFDVIMPTGIPNKGRVLATLSTFWFEKTADIIPNHLLTSDFTKFPTALQRFRPLLEGRSMIVRKCEPLPIECVVRGYLAGSGWKEYNQSQSVCGIKLPAGLTDPPNCLNRFLRQRQKLRLATTKISHSSKLNKLSATKLRSKCAR